MPPPSGMPALVRAHDHALRMSGESAQCVASRPLCDVRKTQSRHRATGLAAQSAKNWFRSVDAYRNGATPGRSRCSPAGSANVTVKNVVLQSSDAVGVVVPEVGRRGELCLRAGNVQGGNTKDQGRAATQIASRILSSALCARANPHAIPRCIPATLGTSGKQLRCRAMREGGSRIVVRCPMPRTSDQQSNQMRKTSNCFGPRLRSACSRESSRISISSLSRDFSRKRCWVLQRTPLAGCCHSRHAPACGDSWNDEPGAQAPVTRRPALVRMPISKA